MRAVRRFVQSGRQLLALTPDVLQQEWASPLRGPQANALLAAVTALEQQARSLQQQMPSLC